jgi:hypothetical protein
MPTRHLWKAMSLYCPNAQALLALKVFCVQCYATLWSKNGPNLSNDSFGWDQNLWAQSHWQARSECSSHKSEILLGLLFEMNVLTTNQTVIVKLSASLPVRVSSSLVLSEWVTSSWSRSCCDRTGFELPIGVASIYHNTGPLALPRHAVSSEEDVLALERAKWSSS